MTAVMWHPGTGGMFDAPDGAVAHYREAGWLLLSEREEHEARAAERAALETAEAEKAKSKAKTGTEGK